MKKKLTVLILSCFLISTPSFAMGRPHHHPHKHHFYKHKPIKQVIVEHNHYYQEGNIEGYYDNYAYETSDRTKNLAVVTGIAGIATIISSFLD